MHYRHVDFAPCVRVFKMSFKLFYVYSSLPIFKKIYVSQILFDDFVSFILYHTCLQTCAQTYATCCLLAAIKQIIQTYSKRSQNLRLLHRTCAVKRPYSSLMNASIAIFLFPPTVQYHKALRLFKFKPASLRF